jgi:hypothetical protein
MKKGIEGEAFDNAKLCSGAPPGAGVGENIITRYQMTVRVEALYSRNPLFADSRRLFYCGLRDLSDGFIVAAFLIVDRGNCVTDDQALADLVMRPQTLQQRIPPALCL